MPYREKIRKWYENMTPGNVYQKQRRLTATNTKGARDCPIIGLSNSYLVDLDTDEPLNIDITCNLGTMKIIVLLIELVKVLSVRKQVAELLHFQERTIGK